MERNNWLRLWTVAQEWKNDTCFIASDKNVVGLKWVCKVNCRADGTVDRFKARLMAWGYAKIHGVVIMIFLHQLQEHGNSSNSCRSSFFEWHFWWRHLHEIAKRLLDTKNPDHVFKLQSLYDLKEAARS